ncbi:TonB-dependent receptor domain-containing protein [Brevundimonas sp. SL161]|uniref:TonB-dependent receptor domain-containing protein n=1 Tax=Brevundimonas sp. SL161 TaxID=2804613 RepID=UPI003CEE6D03
MLTTRKYLFGTTILAGVLTLSAPAFAQSTQPAQDEESVQVEEVIVTGSRIRRDPTNAATPLIQVSRETLLSTGQTSVIDYLATIPALSNSVVPSDTTGGGLNDGGLSLPNLRSLGSGRTLTLVDGRRHVGAAQGSLAVDVDSIPRLLIQNIEIVTGGASSVYGADAVSGVLNFILRKDFEGLEIDANYGQINQDGQANNRVSMLAGINLFDDRLNVYAHAEYDRNEEVRTLDVDWLREAWLLVGTDADPAAANFDSSRDAELFNNLRRLDRPRWGQTTLANSQQPSPLNDPDVALASCTAITSGNCYSVDPTRTYWFDGGTARLANFGQRIGNTGSSRPFNVGGDGENPANFGQESRTPESESQRYQVGANFAVTADINLSLEAKYITEDTFDIGQPTFFDIFLSDTTYTATQTNILRATSQFDLRLDNAFLPANLRNAILANTVTNFTAPTATSAGTPLAATAAPFARHAMFGPQRTQDNTREIQRYVVGLNGQHDRFLFVNNIAWDLSYVYGQAKNENIERGVDVLRFALAADAVVDTAGILGTRGAIVCRARILAATPGTVVADRSRGGDLRDTAQGTLDLNQCQPLNVFGDGNQSAAGLSYVDAAITVSHTNEQEQFLGAVSGQLWDFWGAGAIGVAVGAEHRREFAEGIGRTRTTGNRFLFLNTGADFAAAEYDSNEAFAEVAVPLFRDSWVGQYAELSGSYRYADYSTVGAQEVYGVNLVYRPIQEIAFKTSFNSSIRVPNLGENFAPFSQTFFNGVVDPCATANIITQVNTEVRANRVRNCTALAAAQGRTFDFAGSTPTNVDDYNPVYTSGIAGVNGGNPNLQPEESESFTFSTVLEPSFIPNLSIILDYYEIEITNVIAAVGAQAAVNNCVNGSSLNNAACSTIFRRDPTPGREFYIGAPAGDPIGGFIQGSINYAALSTRGLDFTARYSYDLEEMHGLNLGRLDYSVGGLWLIEQEQFLNTADPTDGTELGSTVFFPRVRLTSSLTYSPNSTWSVNWTVDWQTAQNIIYARDFINNADSRNPDGISTGDFARHDFTVRWNVREDLSMRFGVVNAFDAEQSRYLGTTTTSNFDPWGTRFFIGLNYRPF